MSGTPGSGAPPPEVPDEFAEAYRAAYERALAEREQPPEHAVPERSPAPWTGRPWVVPAVLLGVLALLLVVGAYVVGRVVSDDVGKPAATHGSHSPAPAHKGKQHQQHQKNKDAGKSGTAKGTKATKITGVTASCTDRPGVDSAGHKVTYGAANVADGNPSTAWRCPGRAIGQHLSLELPGGSAVVRVGLVPGYAKTDPASGVDRYAEDNRVTRVRWTFADGTSLVQRLSGDPHDRSMRFLRVPRTASDSVQLEILAVAKGSRNTTAISEVAIRTAP